MNWLPPAALALSASALLAWWLIRSPDKPLHLRVPGTDAAPVMPAGLGTNPVYLGTLIPGTGRMAELPGAWPQFRGSERNGIASEARPALTWPSGRPVELWAMDVGEGYAGPAVLNGRVYLMDYDREAQADVLRCLSLADGSELWRFAYPLAIKRNHGMSRTVPAVTDTLVVAIGPKGHVICCDAITGELRWTLDLALDWRTVIPEWYTGQCPLIDGDRVILAPGAPEALLLAVSLSDGAVLWQTPNPNDWRMTHASVMPMEFAGRRQYVYCASRGVVGVDAADGSVLWETTEWRISIATIPSPVWVEEGRLFLTGGYNAGSLMLQLDAVEGGIAPRTLFRLDADVFGATQHTPVLHQHHLYGIRADGRLVCLSLDGQVVWDSGASDTFGLGPLLVAGDVMFAMNDNGLLRLARASPARYEKLAEARVLDGRESWGPMALAGTRLLVRDFTRLACLDIGSR